MRDHFSVSQMNCYLGCPLKYKFQYVEQCPVPFRPSALAFGSAIHSAIEWYHRKELIGKKVAQNQVWCIFAADWFAQKYDKIMFKRTESEQKFMEMADKMIKIYMNTPVPNTAEAVEIDFSVPIVDPVSGECLDIPLVGRLDKVEQGPTIVDIKTAKQKMSQTDVDSSLQLTAYAYAYWQQYNIIPNLRFDILTKTANPRMERVVTKRSQKHFRIFFLQAKQILNAIDNEIFFANPSWRCTDCEYRNECWYWNGEAKPLVKAA